MSSGLAAAAALALALCAPDARGAEDAPRVRPQAPQAAGLSGARVDGAPSPGAAEASRRALERGLAWLGAQARAGEGGALPTTGAREHAPVAVTALAALAWQAGGSNPGRGPHGEELAAAIDWLVARAELDARSARGGYVSLQGDAVSRMHGHGFATLALVQAWSMSPTSERGKRIERALAAAVDCIQRSQGVEGGWWYEPEKSLSHEGSITICLVQALRAARDAGLEVDRLAVARALDYVSRSQKPNGAFRYALGDEYASVALSAAAIATLQAGGEYEGKPLDEAYVYVLRGLGAREARGTFDRELGVPLPVRGAEAGEFPEGDGRHPYCYLYERLYVAQALWQHPDPRVFESWAGPERARVITSQREDGSWRDPRYGDAYATAINCLFLALPEGLLPIFQR